MLQDLKTQMIKAETKTPKNYHNKQHGRKVEMHSKKLGNLSFE